MKKITGSPIEKAGHFRKLIASRRSSMVATRMEKGFYEEARNQVYRSISKTSVGRLAQLLGEDARDHKVTETDVGTYTGVPSLDLLLGGGLPSGVSEIFGEESSGKTTLAGSILRKSQEIGKITALCPSEDLDMSYLRQLGVDLENLPLIRAKTLETRLELIYDFITEGSPRVVIIDSITGLHPDNDSYLEAHLQWTNLVKSFVSEVQQVIPCGCCIVMTSQARVRRSIDPKKMFAGGTESASRDLVRLFSTRLELLRSEVKPDSYTMVVNVISNCFGQPSRLLEVPVIKGKGVDLDIDYLRVGVALGLITERDRWYYSGANQLGHGERAASKNPHIRQLVDAAIYR